MINRILDLMEKNNITAKQLTSDLEISNSSISDWKRGKGKPSSDAIVKMAEYFNVTTDYLLLGTTCNKTNNINLTENEQEILSLLHKFNKRNQIKFISKVEDLADKMLEKENDTE
ncbi:TPA: helix-turn-helix transcriptional regulator [Clostridioides difficile]|uniref:helix-turn-helix domain-containing protein n=1 Tax=Clostridioides difficile TaxID=1496 RepID=UPI00097FFE6A|nr:helix-turn-helix transcriptional regulator [Clostridioides difficile]MCA0566551.1 helix-turn-helix domain-containing protein [Clostridioides difficile]MCW0819814.1 helix-turn-helix domain-containing protein [Clostridioides difficile]MDC9392427.1 helix-turn-helix transcriptional regulator [Clostridioides difficile]MDK1637555.1 helix-turn-helix transcriptional regulator [Clostridioides difficile]SJW01911.1 Helix-turn-helix [Clostridioides difficile]